MLVRNVDVLTAQEDNITALPDNELLDRAKELARVMSSFDKDMLAIANQYYTENKAFSGLIYVHPLQISITECIRDIELIAKIGELEEFKNTFAFLAIWLSSQENYFFSELACVSINEANLLTVRRSQVCFCDEKQFPLAISCFSSFFFFMFVFMLLQ